MICDIFSKERQAGFQIVKPVLKLILTSLKNFIIDINTYFQEPICLLAPDIFLSSLPGCTRLTSTHTYGHPCRNVKFVNVTQTFNSGLSS